MFYFDICINNKYETRVENDVNKTYLSFPYVFAAYQVNLLDFRGTFDDAIKKVLKKDNDTVELAFLRKTDK